jgi:Xaa-Pro aminopeptidase
MSFNLADGLRKKGYKLEAGPVPFYQERLAKTAEEKRLIEGSQKVIFEAMRLAEGTLRKSRIKGDRIIYRGETLTSEKMQQLLRVFLLERDHFAQEIIVACGMHAIDPHDRGSGPLRPHKSIIVDIFPRSGKTMYYGDATRTFCKGRAPDALKRLYATVKEGQELAISKLRAGVNGKSVHESVMKYFEKKGYKTGEKGGRRQGFFHSTGHSIGLDLHEEPGRIGPRDFIIPKGYVTSVEPGLYYAAIGGVRIEDLVYVTNTGCDILSHYPKNLEIR